MSTCSKKEKVGKAKGKRMVHLLEREWRLEGKN
jgi:hypothetical protein